VKGSGAPQLDTRDAAAVFEELLTRRAAYLPEFAPVPAHPSWALLQIFARYAQTVIDRLDRAPDKNLLAFLDLLGISLIPAQAARAPVVFQPVPSASDGRVAAGTRLGADVPNSAAPVAFETESVMALAAARLVEVTTLWPARDEFASHSAALAGGRPFTLFDPRQAVPHELYLAHDVLLSFASGATIEVEFELTTPGSAPLAIAWEYWDGQTWRPFAPFDPANATVSHDGTNGLTRSGIVTLEADCGKSAKTTIVGIDAFWIRGRLDQPLPPDPARVLPVVDRIRLRTVTTRALQFDSHGEGAGEVKPDQAFADGTQLDLSKTFFPFGQSADKDHAFFFSCEEVLAKPGATVKACFTRVRTPAEEADVLGSRYDVDANRARTLILDAARAAADDALDAGWIVLGHAVPSPNVPGSSTGEASATTILRTKIDTLTNQKNALSQLSDLPSLAAAAEQVAVAIPGVPVGPPLIVRDIGNGTSIIIVEEPYIEARIEKTRSTAAQAAATAANAILTLAGLSPIEAAAAGGAPPISLEPPRLVWEYWGGQGWQTLIGPVDDDAVNFREDGVGKISFVIPKDLEPTDVNGVTARWLRVRLASGSYNRLRLVSWFDSQSNQINFLPVVEARPPALRKFYLGYSYRSPKTAPLHCLTYNDFQYEVRSADATWSGASFPPFQPVADTTPALYLGFDRPLPNDLVSLYLDLNEAEVLPPPLTWEAWDGTAWREVMVTDETGGLGRPGIVSFIAPNVVPRPRATVRQASGTMVVADDVLEVAAFRPGDQVVVAQDDNSDLVTVQQVDDTQITLETPLVNRYTGGAINRAPLPRFGTPRDWVRARLKDDGTPSPGPVNGVYLNAAWAIQVQTIADELLGSGSGQPDQVLFFNQYPVLPGEQIEIRELEGPRAQVEYPILLDEAIQNGLTADDLRPVYDPRTGQVSEVWVRWQVRPYLFFSGPADRHYVVERARGRLMFGDGQNGRLPTVGANNVLARMYRAGGGLVGNVPAGTITQIHSATPFVQSVNNPRAGEGGADGEPVTDVTRRGPETLRHRGRAVSARDYEALAREASPGVAVSRALPTRASNGLPLPGWVTVIIVPWTQEAQPQPSYELRLLVHDYLIARTPATVNPDHLAVVGPTYLSVGVAATVAPRLASEAGAVEERVRDALTAFLHPLTGGPAGNGWPFGQDVYLSDVAVALQQVAGVDYVQGLDLLLNDVPVGDRVAVPPDRIVVAGRIQIDLQAAKR
jgi:hypothetical protein